MKKVLKTTGWVLVGIFVIYTFYFLWKQSQPAPIVYELITPQQRGIVKKTTATGSVEARNQVEVKPLATGVISQLMVQPGKHVNQGDIIATIKIIPDMAQLNQAKSQVESARIASAEQQREFDRIKALYDKGVVSREEYEMKEAQLAEAKESVTAAQTQVEVITKGQSTRSGNVNITSLRSTISGLVLNVPVKVGSSVSGTSAFTEGTTVAKIADMGDIIFRGYIDETEVAKLQQGMEIDLTLGSMQDVKIPATLDYIAPEGELQNGAKMFEMKASAHIPSDINIRSGYSANANIVIAKAEQVLSCDETAIEFADGKTYVYVLTSDPKDEEHQQFERREVSIGISDGLYVELKSGVKAGELIRGIQK
jgi:HlyD family secretion protein